MFKKIVNEENLKLLFDHLKQNAKNKLLTHLFSFVYNKNTIPIFEFLGFFEVDSKGVYIEEKKFDAANLHASVYCYAI